MNDILARDDVVDAIDEIRQRPDNLLASSMAAVRAERDRRWARTDRNPRAISGFAMGVAVLITASMIAVLVGASALRHNTAPRNATQPPAANSVCTLAVQTDRGPGLLEVPSGVFRPAGLPASSATAYNPLTGTWLATPRQGISPDGKLVALLDNIKGHNQTLKLETSAGKVLYVRNNVMRILGWSSDGGLLVTTVDFAGRLLKISADGGHVEWIDPLRNETTMWSFAVGQHVWGVALPYPNPDQHREVVMLDLATKVVSDWYSMLPGSFNDTGYGPILGLTSDGYPIVPQLTSDPRSAIYEIRSKDTPTAVYVIDGEAKNPSQFLPEDATASAFGMWITTTHGDLYASSSSNGLSLMALPGSLHVYSFSGSCS